MAEEDKAKTKSDEKTSESPADQKPADEASAPEQPAVADEQPKAAPPLPAPEVPEGKHYFLGTGRRKTAVARVRIRPGTGNFIVNKNEAAEYFKHDKDRQLILAPLEAVNMIKSWDIWVSVGGGGFTGQAGAVTLGLARAIAKAMPDVESTLRGNRMLTRDARMSERKKYGQKGARKRFQFSKR